VASGVAPRRILVVEDDRETRESIRFALQLEGYEVEAVGDGVSGLGRARCGFDVVVLDVTLPYLDGLSVCRRLRTERHPVAVLMLSARVEVADRVAGLDAGADDYLVKPYALEELLARVRALSRRPPAEEELDAEILEVGGLRLDVGARRAVAGGGDLALTRTEYDLLELLVQNAGVVLTHSVIYERIWGYDFGQDSKNLAVYVGYLRRKLALAGVGGLIRTVRGVGYVLRPLREAEHRPAPASPGSSPA
jgi:two-component system response regulator MprA